MNKKTKIKMIIIASCITISILMTIVGFIILNIASEDEENINNEIIQKNAQS